MSKRSISTLGVLRQAVERGEVAHRTVREEVRENLIQALRGGGCTLDVWAAADSPTGLEDRCLSRKSLERTAIGGDSPVSESDPTPVTCP